MSDLPQLSQLPGKLLPLTVLRNSTFRKRFIASLGGVAIDLTEEGVVVDADIKTATGELIGTFTIALPEVDGTPVPGMFDLELTPAQSLSLPVADTHKTDISITNSNGDRFYYATAQLYVRETVSRNN
jgi:hypothetical protein